MAKKSDYSLFINFFFNSLKNRITHLFLGPHYSLFIFLAHYSLFFIKKGHYSLIIIPHPDPHLWQIIIAFFTLQTALVVVDALLNVAPIVGLCVCSMFGCALLCVLSSFAIILVAKRELVALLKCLSS